VPKVESFSDNTGISTSAGIPGTLLATFMKINSDPLSRF
jgi:hypothetical protein